MSLFSDVDWAILLLAGGLLLLGGHGMGVLRTLGRLYGRFLRLRQELMFDVQSQIMGPHGSAGNGPLPVVEAPAVRPDPDPAPVAASAPAPLPRAPGAAAAAGEASMREVHTGSGFPSEGAELYR